MYSIKSPTDPLVIYLGMDNELELELLKDGLAFDLTAATGAEVKVGSASVDSATAATAFDMTTKAADGVLILKLGQQALTVGAQKMEVAVKTADAAHGLYFGVVTVKVANPGL